jgi:hypothetical protein
MTDEKAVRIEFLAAFFLFRPVSIESIQGLTGLFFFKNPQKYPI